jgi:hypothetical protein
VGAGEGAAVNGLSADLRPDSNGAVLWHSGRLWSLWDMLDYWGYKFFLIGTAIAYTELDLVNYRRQNIGVSTGRDLSIPANNSIVQFLNDKCTEALQFADDQQLSPIPQNLRKIQVKILAASRVLNRRLYVDDLLNDITHIKNDLLSRLSQRSFYSIPPDLLAYYGKPQLFGDAVAKKFPKANDDIEWAGNCLALGQPTACVFHLSRAMEIAIHRLARKLKVPLNAKDNMGSMLGKMTDPIKDMPDKTESQKRKKEVWAECRTNLYHVKMAWRDPGAHGKQTYDDKQARDILKRVSDFMQQLATLL